MTPSFKPIADHALLVTFADQHSEAVHRQIVALDQALSQNSATGMIEATPGMVNLLIDFDVSVTEHTAVSGHVRELLESLNPQAVAGKNRTVQVCYEEPFAPDLSSVAAATGLTIEAVINAHLKGDYSIQMYGFAPGYAYMAGVPEEIQVPRKDAPVRYLVAGSMIIAGPQCLVTTLKMPTRWSIIGRSPTPMFQEGAEEPFLFDVGDTVVFERIDLATFNHLSEGRA